MTSGINCAIKLLLGFYLISLTTACSREEKTWDLAKRNNDELSYNYYLYKYYNGSHSDSARSCLKEINEAKLHAEPPVIPVLLPPVESWDNEPVDSLKITISISAGQSRSFPDELSAIYRNKLIKAFEGMGIVVVPAGGKCSTELKVLLDIVALGKEYAGAGTLYTGYKIRGKISLTAPAQSPIVLNVNEEEPCPFNIYYSKENKEKEIASLRSPGSALQSLNSEKFLDDFLKMAWGTTPFVWIKPVKHFFNLPELESTYEGTYPFGLANNILRASTSEDEKQRKLYLGLTAKEYFPLYPEAFAAIVIYTINTYGLDKDNSDAVLSLVSKLGEQTYKALPVLIEYSATYIDRNVSSDIFKALEKITGLDYGSDLNRWREWWFYNKEEFSNSD